MYAVTFFLHNCNVLKAGALSLDSMFLCFSGHSSGWTFSVTWGKDTSTMVVMHRRACCASFTWLCFRGIWMNAKESGTPTWSVLLSSHAVHLVNLMWCMTCLIGMSLLSITNSRKFCNLFIIYLYNFFQNVHFMSLFNLCTISKWSAYILSGNLKSSYNRGCSNSVP